MSSTGRTIPAFYKGADGNLYVARLRKDLPVSSLAVDGVTATLTIEAHGLGVDDTFNLANCSPAHAFLNDDWTVATAPDADTLTFTLPDAYTQTAATVKPLARHRIECGAYINDATVTATCTDIVALGTLTFDYQTGSNGLYMARVPATAAMVDLTVYTFTIVATAATGEVLPTLMTGPAMYAGF